MRFRVFRYCAQKKKRETENKCIHKIYKAYRSLAFSSLPLAGILGPDITHYTGSDVYI